MSIFRKLAVKAWEFNSHHDHKNNLGYVYFWHSVILFLLVFVIMISAQTWYLFFSNAETIHMTTGDRLMSSVTTKEKLMSYVWVVPILGFGTPMFLFMYNLKLIHDEKMKEQEPTGPRGEVDHTKAPKP